MAHSDLPDAGRVPHFELDRLFEAFLLDKDVLTVVGRVVRTLTTQYRRYYHLALASFDPGKSGATWTSASANNLCGWQLNAVGETLEFQSDVHADWDGASDLTLEVKFQILAASAENNTVDIKLVCYYMAPGDSVTKTQTVEVATNVGDGGGKVQYTMFQVDFLINYDEGGNLVEAGDSVCFIMNLETDTSEVDDILIVDASINYNTTHVGMESGDT